MNLILGIILLMIVFIVTLCFLPWIILCLLKKDKDSEKPDDEGIKAILQDYFNRISQNF